MFSVKLFCFKMLLISINLITVIYIITVNMQLYVYDFFLKQSDVTKKAAVVFVCCAFT